MVLTLLILAAGMGSRYGGLKQIDPVGPSGETMLDYAVYDAMRAGFGRVVFLIRVEFEDAFRNRIASKYSGKIAVDFVFQSVIDLPTGCTLVQGRERPWGTGHAVWCARAALSGPFAVINADDFYGAGSYARLALFLKEAKANRFALGGFRLANTLSESGTVSRGICSEKGGLLQSIVEETAIARTDVGPGCRFSGSEIVSMNFWGFTPCLFEGLEQGLRGFLAKRGSDPKAEFYLPVAVSDLIEAGTSCVEVLPCEDSWFGITYREDRSRVVAAIEALVREGAYPVSLFG